MAIDGDFAVFILTHGRPDKVVTYKSLRRQGYTGPIYLVIDTEDKTGDRYREVYGEQVIAFDKAEAVKLFDKADNFAENRGIVYARNAVYQIARDLGYTYFLQLDDDYTSFVYKYAPDLTYREKPVKNLDKLFSVVLEFYKSIPAATVAMSQNGDWIGGKQNQSAQKRWLKRKAMNTFFCSTERPVTFIGSINEDVNTYVLSGNRGDLFFTFFSAAIIQMSTQQNSGGMTDLYLNSGTYVKSFYTVMFAPSCVKVGEVGYRHRRLHHEIRPETTSRDKLETCRAVRPK